jgi:hypothetical protein
MVTLLDHIPSDYVAVIVAGHEYDAESGVFLFELFGEHGTAHPGHHYVCQKEIGLAGSGVKSTDGFLRAVGNRDFEPRIPKKIFDSAKDILLIIYD